MKRYPLCNRLVLVVLAALLALPMAQSDSPVEAKKRSRTITRTFANPTRIDLPVAAADPVSGSVYPSAVEVGGLRGPVRDVNVVLRGLGHAYPDDVEVLLVGPGGQTAIVMAHVGGPDDVDGVTLRLDDEAAAPLPDNDNEGVPLRSGDFRPTYVVLDDVADPIVFNAPAPAANGNVALSVFDGTDPNGTWRLFVQDLERTDPGAIASGWALEITAKAKAKKKTRR